MSSYETFTVGRAGDRDEVVVSGDGAYATLPPRDWTALEYAEFLNAFVSSSLCAEVRRVVDELVEAGFEELE